MVMEAKVSRFGELVTRRFIRWWRTELYAREGGNWGHRAATSGYNIICSTVVDSLRTTPFSRKSALTKKKDDPPNCSDDSLMMGTICATCGPGRSGRGSTHQNVPPETCIMGTHWHGGQSLGKLTFPQIDISCSTCICNC